MAALELDERCQAAQDNLELLSSEGPVSESKQAATAVPCRDVDKPTPSSNATRIAVLSFSSIGRRPVAVSCIPSD